MTAPTRPSLWEPIRDPWAVKKPSSAKWAAYKTGNKTAVQRTPQRRAECPGDELGEGGSGWIVGHSVLAVVHLILTNDTSAGINPNTPRTCTQTEKYNNQLLFLHLNQIKNYDLTNYCNNLLEKFTSSGTRMNLKQNSSHPHSANRSWE